MKQIFSVCGAMFILLFAFGCKQRTQSISAPSSLEGRWQVVYSCENNSARLDRKVDPFGRFSQEFQLVINHQEAINRMRSEGGINDESINSTGEFILPLWQRPATLTYIGFVNRDAGHLRYQIAQADTSHKMLISVAYTDGDINSTEIKEGYIKGFTGYTFNGCRNVD